MEGRFSLTAVALTALALAPLTMAQSASQATQKKGSDLVAFAQEQKATPAPATQSAQQEQMPQTQTPSTPVGQSQDNADKQPAARTFTGKIMQANDVYVLKTGDNMTYQLDDQARAKDYEGKQVQVTGSLDASSNTIKVQDIKQAA